MIGYDGGERYPRQPIVVSMILSPQQYTYATMLSQLAEGYQLIAPNPDPDLDAMRELVRMLRHGPYMLDALVRL